MNWLSIFLTGWWMTMFFHLFQPEPGHLNIEITGIKSHTGQIRVAIVTRDQYKSDDEVGFGGSIPVNTSNQVSFITPPMPAGKYAVKVFHDVNNNGELDVNLIGIPKEPYGFSNNARGRFGPPDFSAAAITVQPNDTLSVRIDL